MGARLVPLGLAALVVCAGGCTSWSRLSDSRPVPARGTVQVWSAGQEILLRETHRVGDSLIGLEPLPDTTRRTLGLKSIDSLRVQTIDMGKVVIVGTGVSLALLLTWAQGLNFD